MEEGKGAASLPNQGTVEKRRKLPPFFSEKFFTPRSDAFFPRSRGGRRWGRKITFRSCGKRQNDLRLSGVVGGCEPRTTRGSGRLSCRYGKKGGGGGEGTD